MEDPQRGEWYRRFAAWLEQTRPYLEQHNFKEGLAGYPHIVNRSVPWTPWERMEKPLSQARLALVSSCGAYVEGEHEPFDAHNYLGDPTHRTLSWNTDRSRLRIAHEHYDHAAAEQDLNCVLPLDRLQEMRAEGMVGELVEPVYTMSGYALDAWAVRERTAQPIAYRLAEAGAEAALLVPI
ncbi:MAG: hypothetical protein HY685_01620 [Chloroflexi bacterium]|nr:hypothetical protein [Chloroflexota bacterium]